MAQRSDPVEKAVELLAAELRERVRRHPLGHLVPADERLEIRLRLATGSGNGWLAEATRDTSVSLSEALDNLLRHWRIFRPGRAYCLRCRSADCDHASPGRSTEVFAGYGPSGLPRFADLGQWLIEVHDRRVDLLYREPPELVIRVASGPELTASLLPAFRDREGGYRLHGQVAAGWYHAPDGQGHLRPVAVTFQVVSSSGSGRGRRFGLNLLAVGPSGETLETLYDRIGEIPWTAAVHWGQDVLRRIERWAGRRARPARLVEGRLDGMLHGLARRLEKERRSRARRTRHAERRHGEGGRPTRKALADLAGARDEQFLVDTRRQTLVVLGERGRAHVFNAAGKLVTSIRYSPESIDRKRSRGLWRTAGRDEIERLRKQLGG